MLLWTFSTKFKEETTEREGIDKVKDEDNDRG